MTTYTIERTSDPNLVYQALRDHQPRTSHAIGTVLKNELKGRTNRCVFVRDDNGEVAGVVVVFRWLVGRWMALPVLLDPGCAPTVARYIDQGPADGVHTVVHDAELLMPLMQRTARQRV